MRKRIWSKYNKQLVQRGSITFYIDSKTLKEIKKFKGKSTGGRPKEYPDALMNLLLVLKIQYKLTYRALEGFARSIFSMLKRWFKIPDYSTICKRAKDLLQSIPSLSSNKPKVILLDASGIQVFGEGEWKRKIHGVGRPRKWKKIHIAVDANTQEIVAVEITNSNVADCQMVEALLDQTPNELKEVIADGAYDGYRTRESIRKRKAKGLIPPPKNARVKRKDRERDRAILEIMGLGGDKKARSLWGKLTGYSRRALVETAFSRYKRVFSPP